MNTLSASPWIGIVGCGGVLSLLLAVLRIAQRRTRLSPEAIRKLFHLGGSGVALALPWLFDELWPVLVLGAGLVVGFVFMRVVPALRDGAGGVLWDVSRKSGGEFCFLAGVFTAFAIAGDSVLVFSIGILVLAISDTAAALVGVVYGRHTFKVPGGRKSAEGAIAFLVTAFLCIHVPLLLFSEVGRLESLLIAFNLGCLLTLVEADAAVGSDNFALPVLVVVLLETFLGTEVTRLACHSGVIVGLIIFVFFYREHTTLSTDALISAALAGFVFWLFGGWRWLVAPLVLFGSYTLLVGHPRLPVSRPFRADVLLAIVAPGLALATAHAVFHWELLYLPFVAVWGANLAVIGAVHDWLEDPEESMLTQAALNLARSLVVLVPGLFVRVPVSPWSVLAVFLSVAAALALIRLSRAAITGAPTSSASWMRVAVTVSVGTAMSFCAVELVSRGLS